MIGLIDNDIFYKLTCCQLLDETLNYLKVQEHQILDAAPHVITKQTFNKHKSYGHDLPDVQQRLNAAFDRAARIPDQPADLNLFSKLSSIAGIDVGEALLLCSAIETGSALLISGDKRFYNSLANNPDLMAICAQLEGRLICLEHLMLCLVDAYQFPYVCHRVAPARQCDQTLRIAFSSGKDAQQAAVTEALVSYSKQVVLGLGALAYPYRPWYQ